MATETAYGYFPDVRLRYSTNVTTTHLTEVESDPHTGEEQRRARSRSLGRRIWRSESVPQNYVVAKTLLDFLNSLRGQLRGCYFFAPNTEKVELASLGTVTAEASLIVPHKAGSWTEVRVGTAPQVVKDFTVRALTPREGTYVAARINATTQNIGCGTASSLRATGDQSIAAWVNIFSAAAGGVNTICANQSADASGVLFGIDSSRQLYFRTNQAGANTLATSTGTITYGQWVHVAVVRSGTGVTFYINGAAAGTGTGITDPIAATAAFTLSAATGSNTALGGLLSEVRYYDAALSAGEVALIYAGSASASANLKGHWKLSEGYGTSVADSSGYANTGTFGLTTAAPVWVGGEDEITFTAGAQTGAVVGSGIARPRVKVRSTQDEIRSAFLPNAADIRTAFVIELIELVN